MAKNQTVKSDGLLYVQVSEKVMDIIRSRKLKPHDPVPSEGELARQFGVSRMTSKLALESLARQGLVYRLPRRGTFLAGHGNSEEEVFLPQSIEVIEQSRNPKVFRTIAIVVPVLDDFISGIIANVEREARNHNCELIVKLSTDWEDEDSCLQKLVSVVKVDGIILFPNGRNTCSDEVLRLKLLKFPIVIIDRIFREIEIDSVYHDHFHGAYQLAKYLIDKGHRVIGYVSAPLGRITSREERYQGYVQALLDHSIPINTNYINYFTLHYEKSPNFSFREERQELNKYLTENKELSAVICGDDYIAASLMYSALRMKIPVPERLSIVGFSDIELSPLLPVPLTTVRQPTDSLGQSAVKLLVNRMNNLKERALTIKINTMIVERQSVMELK